LEIERLIVIVAIIGIVIANVVDCIVGRITIYLDEFSYLFILFNHEVLEVLVLLNQLKYKSHFHIFRGGMRRRNSVSE
jgi:hypothetical protein